MTTNPASGAPTQKCVVSLAFEDQDLSAIQKGVKAAGQPLDAVAAPSLEEALDIVNKRRPVAIILDWNFAPVETIIIFLQKIRGNVAVSATPILVLVPEPIDEQIIAVSSEYALRGILYHGSAATTIGPALSDVLVDASKPSAMRSFLTKIEQAHAKGSVGELDMAALDFYTLFPNEARAKVEYANFCIRRGQWDKAEDIVSKVVKKEPKNLRAVNIMVRVLLKKRKFDEAQKLLGDAEILSPNNVGRMVLLGDIYREHGMKNEAEAKYRGALEIVPSNREAKQGVAKINLSQGELSSALQLLRESSTQEEIASFFNDAAIVAVQQKNFHEAYKLYKASLSALEKKSLRSRVLYNVGLAYHKENKTDKAIEIFRRAANEDPSFVRAQDTLLAFGVSFEVAPSALDELAEMPLLTPPSPPPSVGLPVADLVAAAKAPSPDAEFSSAPPKAPKSEQNVKQVSDEKQVERWGAWEVVVAEEESKGQEGAAREGTENDGAAPKKSSPAPARQGKITGSASAAPQAPKPAFIDDHEEDL